MAEISRETNTEKKYWTDIKHKFLSNAKKEFYIIHEVEKKNILLKCPEDIYLTLESLIEIKDFLSKVICEIVEDQKETYEKV